MLVFKRRIARILPNISFIAAFNLNQLKFMNTYKCRQCGLVNWNTVEFCKRCQLPNQQAQIVQSQPATHNMAYSNAAPSSLQFTETPVSPNFNNQSQYAAGYGQDFGAHNPVNVYQNSQNSYAQINTSCGMCGVQSNSMKKLYDDDVCKRCHRQYISRRQFAFLLDLIIYRGLATVLLIWADQLTGGSMGLFAFGLSFFPILLKDGTGGVSIGKLAAGLKTIDYPTKQPCGFGKSVLRNIILYIPFMLLIELVFIQSGRRLGDRIVETRVVWNKYGNARVFWK
jgi:hypothetical protein